MSLYQHLSTVVKNNKCMNFTLHLSLYFDRAVCRGMRRICFYLPSVFYTTNITDMSAGGKYFCVFNRYQTTPVLQSIFTDVLSESATFSFCYELFQMGQREERDFV